MREKLNKNIFESEVFNILTENLINGRVDSEVMQNHDYLQKLEEINNLTQIIEESNLTEYQKQTIDRLVSAHESTVNYYIISVYKQAYIDCVSLLKAINLLP